MSTPFWQPGTLYLPGDIVQRNSLPAVVASAPTNADFELGDVSWTKGANWAISPFSNSFNGTVSARCRGAKGEFRLYSSAPVAVVPGMEITASCRVKRGDNGCSGKVQLEWLEDDATTSISISDGSVMNSGEDKWKSSSVTAVAPAGAAYVRIGASAHLGDTDVGLFVDAFQWNYAYQPPTDSLVYRAVQATSGYSGATEPDWPPTLGLQVVDNEVTWEAIDSSQVTWEASPILVSGVTEPTWPTEMGATVIDNTIAWEAVTRRVDDVKCPNTAIVVIAAQKIFCADGDIVAFSATVNPLDWSTPDDAGYLPFGMQANGSTDITALNLYRSNLLAFNGKAFQMWQVDPDPQNMAFLDSAPVGTLYQTSLQPFQNDLVFLSPVGVRNIAIAGASTNLQAGALGKPVDSIVLDRVKNSGYEPLSTFVPAHGQYWLSFGSEAIVLTVNGVKDQSWSRYTFPDPIEAYTNHEGVLYMRLDNGVVLMLDPDQNEDDVYSQPVEPTLYAEVVGYTVELTWTAATFGTVPIGAYVILRSNDDTAGFMEQLAVVDGATLSYTDDSVAHYGTYTYAVIARPSSGGIESERSNTEQVTV